MTIRTAIITLSDKGSAGEREDESGRIIREMIADIGASAVHYEILPDERSRIIETLTRLSDSGNIDLIITTGGTGVAPRDVTPEATLAVIDRQLPGMAEAMRAESLKKTPVLTRISTGFHERNQGETFSQAEAWACRR